MTRRQRRRAARWRAAWVAVAAVGAAVGLTLGIHAADGRSQSAEPTSAGPQPVSPPPDVPGTVGPEGVPVPTAAALAGTTTTAEGSPVDGIQCSVGEQVAFHIHAHLTLFVHGSARQVPYGIGIPGGRTQTTPLGPFVDAGRCFYWLHTHAADGIIHVESPVRRTYTLGDFFDLWGQPLGHDHVGPAVGTVTAIVNGHLFAGDPRTIPLRAHSQIQLDVGPPVVAVEPISFPPGL